MIKNAGVENAGRENVAPDFKGGKCGTGKCGTSMQGWKMRDNRLESSTESLFANKCAEANVRMQKMTLVFHHSTLSCVTVALFVLHLLMCFLCVCFLLS